MQISKIYQTAINKGGQILENGNVYICQKSKYYPNRYIQKVVAPNGSYTIQVSENSNIIKRIFKNILNSNSTVTDSWDFTKTRGVNISTVKINEGKSFMNRVFDKVGESNIKPDGFIYLHHNGKADKYITEVKTLNGTTSTAKLFSPMAWLNDQFYKYFNR